MSDRPHRTILITRPEPAASATAERVAGLGWTPVLAPMATIRPLRPGLPPAGELAGILATSGNAIAAFGAAYHVLPLWAVGRATAARAQAAGFTTVASADGNAQALARLIVARCRPADGPLLLASGRHQGQALAALLRDEGFRVLRRVVYAADPSRTLPHPAETALRNGSITDALFFSAETAQIFYRLVRRAGLALHLHSIDAIAISQQTSMALKDLPWRRLSVAVTPDQDALFALL